MGSGGFFVRAVKVMLPGIVAMSLVLGGLAVAGHDSNTLHACTKDATGALRLVQSADDCRPSETPVEWNVQGSPGPQGPQGVPGYEVVQSADWVLAPGDSVLASVECPDGKVATGGGPLFKSGTLQATVTHSFPHIAGVDWNVAVRNAGASGDVVFIVRATCIAA